MSEWVSECIENCFFFHLVAGRIVRRYASNTFESASWFLTLLTYLGLGFCFFDGHVTDGLKRGFDFRQSEEDRRTGRCGKVWEGVGVVFFFSFFFFCKRGGEGFLRCGWMDGWMYAIFFDFRF